MVASLGDRAGAAAALTPGGAGTAPPPEHPEPNAMATAVTAKRAYRAFASMAETFPERRGDVSHLIILPPSFE